MTEFGPRFRQSDPDDRCRAHHADVGAAEGEGRSLRL